MISAMPNKHAKGRTARAVEPRKTERGVAARGGHPLLERRQLARSGVVRADRGGGFCELRDDLGGERALPSAGEAAKRSVAKSATGPGLPHSGQPTANTGSG